VEQATSEVVATPDVSMAAVERATSEVAATPGVSMGVGSRTQEAASMSE
jgi:hypothetical protein